MSHCRRWEMLDKHTFHYKWGWVKRIRHATYEYDRCIWVYVCINCGRTQIKEERMNRMPGKRINDWRAAWDEELYAYRAKVAAILAENPTLSARELGRHLGCSHQTALKWKKRILAEVKS